MQRDRCFPVGRGPLPLPLDPSRKLTQFSHQAGLCTVLEMEAGLGWQTLVAEEELHKYDGRSRPGSRRKRRGILRDQWSSAK